MKASKYFFIFLVAAFLSSCTDVIDLDLDETETLLVVEGQVNDRDSIQWVLLSYTKPYFDDNPTDYTVEAGALVLMYENDVLIDTMNFNPNSNRFESNFTGTRGAEYRIEITTTDGQNYSSNKEILPEVTSIDTIWVELEDEGFNEGEYVIYIESQEIPGLGNNYQWKSYVNGIYQDTPDDLVFASDELVDGNYISEFDVFELDEDDIEFYTSISDSITVKIEQLGITSSHYEFLSDLYSQTAISGTPFSPPPAELRGNVSNTSNGVRALGIFSAVSVEEISITFKPE